MEWHQLEYFEKMAQIQHFTKAADALSISQPALSRSIAKLEKELGCPLFERKGKSVILNRYGKIFLVHVKKSMNEIADGSRIISDLIHPDHGCISIAFLLSLGRTLIPRLLNDFRIQFPNVQFKLFQNVSIALTKQLKEGEVDFCLYAPVNIEGIEFIPLYSDKMFLIVSKKHRLSGRASVYVDEFANEPLITIKKGYDMRILTEQCFAEANVTPNVVFELQDILTIASLVEANLGVALIPYTSGLDKLDISFIPINEIETKRITGIAWIKDRYLPPAAKKFKDFVIKSG